MATERKLRGAQEDKLFDLLWTLRLLEKGKLPNPGGHIKVLSNKAMSGMTAEEIDAVRQRVADSYAAMYGEES